MTRNSGQWDRGSLAGGEAADTDRSSHAPSASATAPREPVVVALLAAPGATASTLYGFVDVLAGTRRDWAMLHGRDATSPFRTVVVTRDGEPVTGVNGVRIAPDASFAGCPRPDIVCIADLFVLPGDPVEELYDREIAWLRDCHSGGALIGSACSGAIVVAATGLLDGCDATSHWAYCSALARRHPRTRWNPDRTLLFTGRDRRIVMAGSGTSWQMLALALIARYAGPDEAMRVARVNLLDLQAASPIAYASLAHGGPSTDAAIAAAQAWVAEHYVEDSPVARMAAVSGLPLRTFKRRFAQTTGMAPLEYVHALRLEEAKHLLERTEDSVETIAAAVGYENGAFFGRLFRRRTTLTPAQYRRRFGRLSRTLEELADR